MIRAALRPLALAAAGSLALGCSLLRPQADLSRFYLLTSTGGDSSGGSALALGVGPIALPGYLAVPEIQVRASASEVRRSGIDRWAEPLDEGIARVLVQDLSAELGTRDVVLFPWYADHTPTLQVSLAVRRFELDHDRSALLEARYQVIATASGKRLIQDVEIRKQPANADTAASVTALSEALGELAARIAADVRSFPAAR